MICYIKKKKKKKMNSWIYICFINIFLFKFICKTSKRLFNGSIVTTYPI